MSDEFPGLPAQSLLKSSANCWRIERASRASLIVDAADYYRHARQAMLQAKHQILLIGWDFDTRIDFSGDANDGAPTRLGPFISWLARNRPELQIYILKWDIGALKLLGRGTTILRIARWKRQPRITFKLDGAHPPGASHHQKILVIDDAFAFCGGIDMTAARWDTRDHKDGDPGRKRPTTGRSYGPWHDATMAVEGDVARALGEHSRDRWKAACGDEISRPPRCASPWPETLEPMFEDVEIAISRTRGATNTLTPIREIEQLFLDMIGSAQRFIYAENQYFASRVIARAIANRLQERDGPEIVLVNPQTANGWLEEEVMGPARAELFHYLRSIDTQNRFRIYTPRTATEQDIYVHAKIMIVDDLILRVGSANLNNRSMGLDSECDLTIDSTVSTDPSICRSIEAIRTGLLSEHLSAPHEEIRSRLRQSGSLIATIEGLRGSGRSLHPFEPPSFNNLEKTIALTEVLDPESAGEDYEPVAKPGLRRLGLGRKKTPPMGRAGPGSTDCVRELRSSDTLKTRWKDAGSST